MGEWQPVCCQVAVGCCATVGGWRGDHQPSSSLRLVGLMAVLMLSSVSLLALVLTPDLLAVSHPTPTTALSLLLNNQTNRTTTDNLQRSEFEDTPFMREGWVYVDGNDAAGRSVVVSSHGLAQHAHNQQSCFLVGLHHTQLQSGSNDVSTQQQFATCLHPSCKLTRVAVIV